MLALGDQWLYALVETGWMTAYCATETTYVCGAVGGPDEEKNKSEWGGGTDTPSDEDTWLVHPRRNDT